MARKLGTFWTFLGLGLLAASGVLINLKGFVYFLLCWPGCVLLMTGGCHILIPEKPAIITGKDPETGRIGVTTAVVMAPYFILIWAWWFIRVGGLKLFKGEAAYDEVWEGVYVARYPLRARNIPSNVVLVVDLTAEFPGVVPEGVQYINCPAFDTGTPDPMLWYQAARIIAEVRPAKKGKVFVHCAYGHGRSGITVALAMLITEAAGSLGECARLMRVHRPCIRWHANQKEVVRGILEHADALARHTRRGSRYSAPTLTPLGDVEGDAGDGGDAPEVVDVDVSPGIDTTRTPPDAVIETAC